jgi:lactoylglutathione lyase
MIYGYLLTTAWIAATAAPILMAQTMGGPVRPQIVGVASIRLKTNDLAAARTFYGKYLGYEDPFQLDTMAVFKVNDHQYIEVEPTLKAENEDRLIHIAFETTDAKQLRDYLAAKGVVVPTSVQPDHDGNLSFFIKDGDGHPVEFVQYMPGSLHSRNFGKAIGANRISDRMIHVGFTIQDRAAADRLFKEILGFRLQWYGGMKDDVAEWVSMRVPDGSDWLEYMLNQPHPSPKTLGVMNHLALGVPSAEAGYKTVVERGMTPTEKPKIGRDGKYQLNLYDPNFTRAELMEPKPVQAPCCSPIIEY